jgi:hypothetical protein
MTAAQNFVIQQIAADMVLVIIRPELALVIQDISDMHVMFQTLTVLTVAKVMVTVIEQLVFADVSQVM